MPGDVFEKDPCGLDFTDDPGDVGPQVPLVVFPFALSCMAERLAGVSGEDGVDRPPERCPVEGSNVIPDRGRGKVLGSLRSDDDLAGIFLPLDEASRVESWLCEHEAKIQSTAACAEGESVSGTWHHIHSAASRTTGSASRAAFHSR